MPIYTRCVHCFREVSTTDMTCPFCGTRQSYNDVPATNLPLTFPGSSTAFPAQSGVSPNSTSCPPTLASEKLFAPQEGNFTSTTKAPENSVSGDAGGSLEQTSGFIDSESNASKHSAYTTATNPDADGWCGKEYGDISKVPARTADEQEAYENRMFSMMSYIPGLCFIPMYFRRDVPIAKFHGWQGFRYFILFAAWWLFTQKLPVLIALLTKNVLWGLVIVVSKAFLLLFLGWALIGMYYAYKGRFEPLPLIGRIGMKRRK